MSDILLSLLCVILTIGFYTGELDWLLIYYGCAPDDKKAKMNCELITLISWVSMLVITVLLVICFLSNLYGFTVISGILHKICAVIFLSMILITFKLSMVD